MQINSTDNKKMLWDLLSPTFPDNTNCKRKMQLFIDKRTELFHKDRFKHSNNIMEMNKKLLIQAKQYLKSVLQTTAVINHKVKTKEIYPQNQAVDRNYDKFVTKKGQKTVFENRLREKQDSFSQLIEGKKPKRIDFSDKADKPISTMSHLIDETLAARQKELESITTNYTNEGVETWLVNGGKQNRKQTNIKIQNEIKGILKPIEISTQKKVTFEEKEETEKENTTSSFFSRLKQRSNNSDRELVQHNNNSDRELLQQIIENQEKLMITQTEILEYLNKTNA